MITSSVYLPPSLTPTPPYSSSNEDDDSHSKDCDHAYLHDQKPCGTRSRRLNAAFDLGLHSDDDDDDDNNNDDSNTDSPDLKIHSVQARNARSARECSVNHSIQKSFLEPICDDCLLDELGIKQRSGSGLLPHVNGADARDNESENEEEQQTRDAGEESGRARHVRNGSGLIWSFDVQIEITPLPSPTTLPDGGLTSGDIEALTAPARPSSAVPSDEIGPISELGDRSKRSLPSTYDSSKRISSSIDLARRRPSLVTELEAYLEKGADSERTAPQRRFDGKDTKIRESSVEIKVLDEPGLHHAPQSGRLPSPAPSSPTLRFLSTHLSHVAIDTTPSEIGVDAPPRHPSTVSTSTSTFAADADDESSLYTSSPLQCLSSATLLPNVTHRRHRPRSTTKALRRRGMDISRSSLALRISSRWTSGERECLRGFKEDLLGQSIKQEENLTSNDIILNSAPHLPVESEHEHKRDRRREVRAKTEKKATAKDQSQIDQSRDILHNLENVQTPGGQDSIDGAEAERAPDLNVDPAQPAPIKLHLGQELIDTKPHGEDGFTSRRGRQRSRSPVKALLTRFAEAQNGGKTWARGVLGELKKSLGRDSRGSSRTAREGARRCGHNGFDAVRAVPIELPHPGVRTLRAAIDPFEDIDQAQTEKIQSQTSEAAKSTRRGSAQTSESERRAGGSDGNLYIHPTASYSVPTSSESWQAHLANDLTLPRVSKQHMLRHVGLSKSEVKLPYDAGVDRHEEMLQRRKSSAATFDRNFMSRSSQLLPSATGEYPLEAQCQQHYQIGDEDEESKRRLLSPVSGPSMPATASSASSRTWVGETLGSGSGLSSVPDSGHWKWRGERLASIVSSGEFEIDDELIGNPWTESKTDDLANTTAENPFDQVVGHEGTKVKDNLGDSGEGEARETAIPYHHASDAAPLAATHTTNYPQQQPRPRNPTPSSTPTFRFKPQLQSQSKPSKSAQALTKHPLSTPLCIITPNRPILPLRTSSLSSPPMSTPTRIGLPVSKTMLTYSPTENFACIWQRWPCAGADGRGECGRIIREVVVSCICGVPESKADADAEYGKVGMEVAEKDGHEALTPHLKRQDVICRSTAPVVRYTEAVPWGWEGDGQGSEGASRRMCEQCRMGA